MSYSIDANVLLYAANRAAPENAAATAFLTQTVTRPDILVLAWVTVAAFLRIATHPRIFPSPLTPSQAEDSIERLLAVPHVRLVAEQDAFWTGYRSASSPSNRGNSVPDTFLAAILRQHGVKTLYTRDAAFRRFAFLDIRDPFVPASP